MSNRIAVTGHLNTRDLEQLGARLSRAFTVEQSSSFSDLLTAIDNADRDLQRGCNQARQTVPQITTKA